MNKKDEEGLLKYAGEFAKEWFRVCGLSLEEAMFFWSFAGAEEYHRLKSLAEASSPPPDLGINVSDGFSLGERIG